RPNILQVHRNRVVVEVPVAVREAPATDIRRDDPVARRQVRRQVAEIAAVAHQAVQAEHHRRVRRGTRVHPAEEPEAIVAVVPVLGHRAAPLLAPAVPGAALVYIPAVGNFFFKQKTAYEILRQFEKLNAGKGTEWAPESK